MMFRHSQSKILLFLLGLCGLSFATTQALSQPHSANLPTTPEQTTPKPRILSDDEAIPRYEHIFVIIAENKSYEQIIGNTQAPQLNQLAQTYGLATQFYGEVHPSEANYIAMLGGDTFGIHDDDAFYCKAGMRNTFCQEARSPDYANHTIDQPSLMGQLEQHNLTWKGYFEDLPEPGSTEIVAPGRINALYAAKHNGFMNFKMVQDDPKRAEKIVNLTQLATDLQNNNAPNYSHIVLNQCHDMHGLPKCPFGLVRTGDAQIAQIVQQIQQSSLWADAKNSAIVITWDENNGDPRGQTGCCAYDPQSAANFGGGHIATIVITNHGPKGITDSTPYNHYSLLRTTEDAFGIHEYLNHADDVAQGVRPMTKLFRVIGQ